MGGGAHAGVAIVAGDATEQVKIAEAFQRDAANGRVRILPSQFVQRRIGVLQFPHGLFTGLGIGVLPLGLEEAAQDHGMVAGIGTGFGSASLGDGPWIGSILELLYHSGGTGGGLGAGWIKTLLRVFALVFTAKMNGIIHWNPGKLPKGVRRES